MLLTPRRCGTSASLLWSLPKISFWRYCANKAFIFKFDMCYPQINFYKVLVKYLMWHTYSTSVQSFPSWAFMFTVQASLKNKHYNFSNTLVLMCIVYIPDSMYLWRVDSKAGTGKGGKFSSYWNVFSFTRWPDFASRVAFEDILAFGAGRDERTWKGIRNLHSHGKSCHANYKISFLKSHKILCDIGDEKLAVSLLFSGSHHFV